MSLLKAAQESITNQVKHRALNAFLNVPHRASQLELAQAADEREATGLNTLTRTTALIAK